MQSNVVLAVSCLRLSSKPAGIISWLSLEARGPPGGIDALASYVKIASATGERNLIRIFIYNKTRFSAFL